MSGHYERKDHFYQRAKDEGARSRAVFKLRELNQKYKLIKQGYKILDLGAWPGGWLEVAAELSGASGLAVGIDLKELEDFGRPNIKVITGDVADRALIEQACQFAGGQFDLVQSDMSPKLSGIKEVDRMAATACAELAFDAAKIALRTEGALVIKLFKSNEAELFVKSMRPVFNNVVREELKSSRKSSTEFYLVALGYKPPPNR